MFDIYRMEVVTIFISFRDSFFNNISAPTLKKKLTIWRVPELKGTGSTGTTLRACWCVVMELTSSLYVWAMCFGKERAWSTGLHLVYCVDNILVGEVQVGAEVKVEVNFGQGFILL